MENNQKAYQLFSSFKNKYYQDDSEKQDGNNLELDDDMKHLLQKINKQSKKSSTTRLKALQQAAQLISQQPESYFESFLKIFMIIYEKILTCEEDVKVLMELQKCMRIVIQRGENVTKKNFPQIFPFLYFATFEPNKELSEYTRESLCLLLKSNEKIAKSTLAFREKVFSFLKSIITDKTNFISNMSIYDDKEINDIIYKKLLSMSWWTIADIVDKSSNLKAEEKQLVIEKVKQLVLSSENPLSLSIFSSAGDDYVLKAAILYFWNLILTQKLESDETLLKKIVQVILINNLDDNSNSFQNILWTNGFIFLLFEHGKTFKLNSDVIQKKFQNLVENHCFGIGNLFYDNFEKSLELLIVDENQERAEILFKKLIFAHFRSVLKDDLQFDITPHYKIGFDIILHQLEKSKLKPINETQIKKGKVKFDCFSSDFIIVEVIDQLIQLFLDNNNFAQKNLNVISINMIKFFPSAFSQFFIDVQKREFEVKNSFLDASIALFQKVSRTVFQNLLKDVKKVTNFGLLVKYFLNFLDVSNVDLKEKSILCQFLIIAFKDIEESFKKHHSEKLKSDTFDETFIELTNMSFFVKELGEKNLFDFCQTVSKFDDSFDSKLLHFSEYMNSLFVSLIVEQKVNQILIVQTSIDQYVDFFTDFLKSFAFKINFTEILNQMITYCNKSIIEISSKGQWRKLLSILLERETIKSIGNNLNTFDDDFLGFFNKIIKLKTPKSKDYCSILIKNDRFLTLYSELLELVYKRNISQLSLPVLTYLDINGEGVIKTISDFLQNYYNDKTSIEFTNNERFKLCLTFEIMKSLNEHDFTLISNSLLKFFDKIDSKQLEILIKNSTEVFSVLGKTCILQFYQILVDKILNLSTPKPELIEIFKEISKLVNNSIENSNKSQLSIFLENKFLSYFLTYKSEDCSTTDIFRLIAKNLPNFNFSKVIENVVSNSIEKEDIRNTFLINFITQPNALHNFSSQKRRQFWNQMVNGIALSNMLTIFEQNPKKFCTILFCLLDNCRKDFSISTFVKKALKQILNDETIDKKSTDFIFEELQNYFISLFKEDSILEEVLFLYKNIMMVLPLKRFWTEKNYEKICSQEFDEIQHAMNVFFAIKSNLITQESLTPEKLNIETCQLEISNLGKLLHLQVDVLKKYLKSEQFGIISTTLFLEYIDFSIEKHEESILANNSVLLEETLLEILKMAENNFSTRFSQNSFFAFLVLLRKLIHVLEMFSEKFESDILKKISLYSLKFSLGIKNNILMKSYFWTISPDDFFNEIAETISRFAIRDVTKISTDELFELLEIEINSIKRSSFFLVQQFKLPFSITKSNMDEYLISENPVPMIMYHFSPKMSVLINGGINDDDLTFFLKWAYILQTCNGQTVEAQLNFQILSTLFSEEKKFYNILMNRIFSYLFDKNLNFNEMEELVDRLDFVNPEKVWGDSITEEVEDCFAIHIFYNLTYLFQKSLRSWLEFEKKYSSIALTILKKSISEQIFTRELDKIELTQHEWKNEEFDVFFNKKTREIFAIYFKDDTKLEVVLSVPSNFPVKQIAIKVMNKGKLSEDFEKKWKLQISRVLTNQNKNIIDAIIFWRKNLDKMFDGIEPCFICYCILSPTSNQVPSKKCKTCKKLLHADCIQKWFATSHKSDCPLCKSQFL